MLKAASVLAALAIVLTPISTRAQQATELAQPADFGISLARPTGSDLASLHDLRYRLPGILLGGWVVESELGRSTLYVVAQEHEQTPTVESAAATLTEILRAPGLQPRVNTAHSVLQGPAFAISVEGPGYGFALDGVGGAPVGGKVPTYMRVVGAPLVPQNQQTTQNLLLFVAVAPLEALDPCRVAMEELLTGSTHTEETPASTPPSVTASRAMPESEQPAPSSEAPLAQPEEPTTPEGFFLALKAPAKEWVAATEADLPDRVDGQYLSGWVRETDHGNAAIYVLGRRATGKFMVSQLGEAMHATLSGAGLEADLEEDLSVLGRPAFMLSVWGQGTGLALNALSSAGSSGSTATFLRLITLVNPWEGGTHGVDFIKIVAVGPLKAVEDCLEAFGDVVEGSELRGSYSSPPPTPEPAPEPAQPQSAPAPEGLVDAGTNVFGSVYHINGATVSMRSLRVLRAANDGGTDTWLAPNNMPGDGILLLVSSDGMRAWVLTPADLASIGAESPSGTAISDGNSLIPYRANWNELLR